MSSQTVDHPLMPAVLVMPTHQGEDVLSVLVTLPGSTAKKWVDLRKEHGIDDEDLADLLMHRYEVTNHLFVPVPSSSGSSTTFTFNGLIGEDGEDQSMKPVKKRGRPARTRVEVSSPPKPSKKKTTRRESAEDPATNPSGKSSLRQKGERAKESSESEDSESEDSESDTADDSNTIEGTTSEDYNPSVESETEADSMVVGGILKDEEEDDEEEEEEKPKRPKYETGDGALINQYDVKEVAKAEGVIPKEPSRPRAKLQRKYWSSLTKQYQCKLCSFESQNPKLICQHLLQHHGENVEELRDYLLSKPEFLVSEPAADSEPGNTLFDVVMAERLPLNDLNNSNSVKRAADGVDGGLSRQTDGSPDRGANKTFQIPSFERGFGLTRAEAAQTLANVAETATVAQLEEKDLSHRQPLFQRGVLEVGVGQLPSDVAQAQLELMQRQLDAAHGLTHPPGFPHPSGLPHPPGGLSLHMNVTESAFSPSHGRHMQGIEGGGHLSPMLQSYPIHTSSGLTPTQETLSFQQVCDPLVSLGGGSSVQGERGERLPNSQDDRMLISQGMVGHHQTIVGEAQPIGQSVVQPMAQSVVQPLAQSMASQQQEDHLAQPLEAISEPQRVNGSQLVEEGHSLEPLKPLTRLEVTGTDLLIKPEPGNVTPKEGVEVEADKMGGGEQVEVGDEWMGGDDGQSVEGAEDANTGFTESPPRVASMEQGETDQKTDGQTEEAAQPITRRTRSAAKMKSQPPPPADTKMKSRGRPKRSRGPKKTPDPPPEKEDPFDEIEFLQILMKWVKIMVSCPTCGKSLHNLGVINKKGVKISHVCRTDEKSGDSEILCHLCGKSFVSGRGFKIHWQEYHGSMERAVCQFCGKVVKGSYLTQHINRCHTETGASFPCAMCGKAFKSKSACDKHEVVHRTDKPFKCPYCGRGFTQQANMKHHTRQHTGEQPYRCETCSKAFTHNVSLKNHLKRQHGVDLWQMGHTGGGRPKKYRPPPTHTERPIEEVEGNPFIYKIKSGEPL